MSGHLNELPAGWHWSTVADVGHIQLGRQRSPKNHTGTHMRPYLRVANVFEDRIDTSDVMEMNFTPDEFERYQLQPGDILLNEGQTPELLGRPAMYRGNPGEMAFTNSLIRFQAGPDVLPEWALLVFRHHMRSGRFTRESRITTNIAHLSASRFKTVEFPVPPLEVQRLLARRCAEAEERLARIEPGLIQLRRRLSALAEDTIRRACLGRLGTSGVGEEPAAEMLARRLGVTAEAPEDGLPLLPAGWQWSTLGVLAEVAGGITKDAAKQNAVGMVEVPYLRVANVHRGELRLNDIARIRVTPAKLEALRLQVGDVLMNEGGDRDKLGRGWIWEGQIVDCIHQNHVFRARVRAGVLHPKLLSWHGNTFGQRWFEAAGKQTTNLASLSMTNLRRLPVPVGPLEEQVRIVSEVERQLSVIHTTLTGLATLRRECDALRSSLLAQAFKGNLVPSDPPVVAAVPEQGSGQTDTEGPGPAANGRKVRTVRVPTSATQRKATP